MFIKQTITLSKSIINLNRSVVTQIRYFRRDDRPTKLYSEPVIKYEGLTKPEVDLALHDPEGTFSPKVIEFIKARDFENSGGRKLDVIDFHTGEIKGTVEGNDFVLGANPRIDILHRNMVWYRACVRAGTASTKTRAEVRGGGRKPWPQKGTGRARHGSIRSPLWRGGGRSHGPKPRDYSYNLPHDIRRLGLRTALSCRLAQGDLTIIESLDSLSPDPEEFQETLIARDLGLNVHLVDAFQNDVLDDVTASFDHVTCTHALHLHVYGILIRHKLILTLDALRVLEEKLAEDGRIFTDPNYELHHQDMLFDKNLFDHEYDPKRKKIMKKYIKPPLPPSIAKKPRRKGRLDLRWWHSRGLR